MPLAPNAVDLVWLKEFARRMEVGEPLDSRAMMVALRDQLPRGFKPSDIDGRLLYGSGPSVDGLVALGDPTGLLPELDRTLSHVRLRLLEHPSLSKVAAPEIAEVLGVSEARAERLLMLVGSLGRFWSGATGGSNGYVDITLGGDDVLANYLAFESLKTLLEKRDAQRSHAATEPSQRPAPIPGASIVANSAFILMNMDPLDDALTDVCNAIKLECSLFSISAIRIDDIEHQDRITDRILAQIASSELIIADLSGERPNVYYEVGYSHALGKRPILYRRKGTRLHFDLAVHNVPEYRNTTELRALLHKRLEAILGRSVAST